MCKYIYLWVFTNKGMTNRMLCMNCDCSNFPLRSCQGWGLHTPSILWPSGEPPSWHQVCAAAESWAEVSEGKREGILGCAVQRGKDCMYVIQVLLETYLLILICSFYFNMLITLNFYFSVSYQLQRELRWNG